MGLGKTVQVIALLLDGMTGPHRRNRSNPDLLIVPASLIANWKSELARFAPSLEYVVLHPSEPPVSNKAVGSKLVITTYGMLTRTEWLRQQAWHLVVLDEAQAIKNGGARQSRAVKELQAQG